MSLSILTSLFISHPKAYFLINDQYGNPTCTPYNDSQKSINFAGLFMALADHSGDNYENMIFGIDELE